jgi:geranylgeranyl pyrophosphate synthase
MLFENESPPDALVTEVVGIVSEAGGLEYARRRGADFAGEANDALAKLPDTPVRAALADAIVYVMERRS